jgi:hypothetical protein
MPLPGAGGEHAIGGARVLVRLDRGERLGVLGSQFGVAIEHALDGISPASLATRCRTQAACSAR